ncbi:gluconolaconase [soil metagenome]
MRYLLILILVLFLNIGVFAQEDQEISVTQKWATDQVFKNPESVFFDSLRNVIYVSNIGEINKDSRDGDGFISKLNLNGEVEELRWITGLNDPKGMGMFGNILYVADLNQVVEINVENNEIVRTHEVEGAEFLNDITVARTGEVYISDSDANLVFRIRLGMPPMVWMTDDSGLNRPNGLLIEEERLLLANMAEGTLNLVNPESKEMREWVSGVNSADGIARVGENNYFVSNWNGEVWFIDFKGSKQKVLDTKDEKVNAADITHINSLNILLVPTFFDNRVVAYDIENLQ